MSVYFTKCTTFDIFHFKANFAQKLVMLPVPSSPDESRRILERDLFTEKGVIYKDCGQPIFKGILR